MAGVCAGMAGSGYCADLDQKTDTQLQEMVIKGDKPAVPANLPATTEGVTARQIAESINAVTSAAVLQYLPSVHVRERYIGDVNGVLVMRVNSSIASAQTTVYADNLLLSNFLNNSFSTAPRWGMVSPEEIDRVDVIYGPFSALYPGNSAGGVVQMTTHMPSKFEAHAKLDIFGENFRLYGTDKNFNGVHGSASLGNKVGDWSFWLNGDRLDNHGHPMTFTAATAKAAPAAVAGQFTVVTGALSDLDTANQPRVTTAAASIDHTVQDNGKIKVAYDFSPTVRATYTLGIWQNTSDKTGDSYLRDVAGNTIYGTGGAGVYKYVRINGQDYTVTAPSTSNYIGEHWMHGLSVKSSAGGTWDGEVIVSSFNQNKDITRTSSGNSGTTPSDAATAGTVAIADGTGWQSIDLRGEWRPDGNLKSKHQVSFGYHTDAYVTKTDTYNLVAGINWFTSDAGTLSANSRGKTETQALYLQDAWQFDPAWKLVAGGRMESWKASDGSNYASGANVTYQDRTATAFSPKAALSYQATSDWALRGSFGKGVRFPTVGELFTNIGIKDLAGNNATAGQIAGFPAPYNSAKTNNPNLKPESVNSWEFTAEKELGNGLWRTSLFWEDKQDALVSQNDITTLPGFSISGIQNVDKIRTRGIETALQVSDLWIRGFDLSGSATYANSKILSNQLDPGLVGTDQPRIPDWRATLMGVYHASDRLSYSLSYRFSGRQHNALYNTTTKQYTDPNPNVYGAVSHYSVFDAKVLYKVAKQWTASFGINNIGDFKYYVNPNPYPQRTFFASVKFDY